MLKDLILANRSYRRFVESLRVDESVLRSLVDLARLSPSARNVQPLKYFFVTGNQECETVFANCGFAGYLGAEGRPAHGERPPAYIIVLADKDLTDNYWFDHGVAAQSILLGAVEWGLGGCILGSINKKAVAEAFGIPEQFEILMAVAIGKPNEAVVLEEMKDGEVKYWRDEMGVHHVPKRSLDEIIVKF